MFDMFTQEGEFQDTRDLQSIKDTIIGEIACKKNISGEHDTMQGVVKVVTRAIKDEEFNFALDKVASTLLELFPPKLKVVRDVTNIKSNK